MSNSGKQRVPYLGDNVDRKTPEEHQRRKNIKIGVGDYVEQK